MSIVLYAKNMAGDIHPLTLPVIQTYHSLRSALVSLFTPHDPTRLRLLAHLVQEKDLGEQKQEQGQGKEQDMSLDVWNDGDCVLYLLQDPVPLTVHFSPSISLLYPSTSTGRLLKHPYYLIHVTLSNPYGHIMYRYSFLFSLHDGTFIPPSQYELEEDDGNSYLFIRYSSSSFSSIYDLLQKDPSIPTRFRSTLFRSAYRKWSRILRILASSTNRRHFPAEYHQLRQYFYSFHSRSYSH